jgi:CubicO group peptidase (beta-lactamase class C family)
MAVESKLERLVRQTQHQARVPALTAALHRQDRPLWTFQIGTSGRDDRPLDAGTRFRIGSITKTFTAVLVLQCRDDGLLDLDDPIGKHLTISRHGDLTVRRLLSHTSGIQREPHGDVWDTLDMPDAQRLLSDLGQAERVLTPSRRFHYSNVGFALLGQLVAHLRGAEWADVLRDRVLTPLGLHDVVTDPGEQAAVGYLVHPYSDEARPEPPVNIGAIAPAGQLWGTAADLARWAAFLADPSIVDPGGAVLKESTLEEMRWPLTTSDETLWGEGFGLGLILVPQGERIVHIGHDGAMPGFLAGAYGRRAPARFHPPHAFGAAVLGSSGAGIATVTLPHTLLATSAEEDPADIEPWAPGKPPPQRYASVLGRWWSEGFEFTFFWRDGELHARREVDPVDRPPAVFAEAGEDELRTVRGREVGERIRLHRDPATGDVDRMNWATYRFTRTQETFEPPR